MLSNRVLAAFLIVFILSIIVGMMSILSMVDQLTGFAGQEQAAQVSVTVATFCGDNVKSQNEVCDGPDLAGQTCLNFGTNTGGTLSCLADCTAFNQTLCVDATVNVTEEEVVVAPRGVSIGGINPPLIFNADEQNTYDFATTGLQDVFIIFKKEMYTVNALKVNGNSSNLVISYPNGRPQSTLSFTLGQTKPVDLDGDGTLDLYFTLTDILTRRSAYHIEVIRRKPLPTPQIEQIPSTIGPKTEIPSPETEDYSEYYLESILILIILIVAIINFGLFKRHMASKSSKK